MFSKDNRRFTLLLLSIVAIVFLTVVAFILLLTVDLESGDHKINSTTISSLVMVSGFVAVFINQLIVAMKAEQTRLQSYDERKAIAVKVEEIAGKVDEAAHKVDETKAKLIETKEKLEGSDFPKTATELRCLLHTFAQEMCSEIAKSAAKAAAIEAIEEFELRHPHLAQP